MNILAIDPGPDYSGWARIITIQDHQDIEGGILPSSMVLAQLLAHRPPCDLLAIEFPQNMGMPASQEVLNTAAIAGMVEWQGRCWGLSLAQVHRVKRTDVKLHLCQIARAKDKHVRSVLLDRWGKQGTKKNPGPTFGFSGDAWAALAVATYAFDTIGRG